ncbi:hypothetical protein QBC34DRAFT_177375 [Podospora aff. communis PSN243]|uniref:Uncharacterized protein n=1 Tax=Podospora aff. communis PSN243 TaxID=3040156 RepID=A0AAV9H0H0_9PEZI|nr:hypothetical protein QBC34DRAFT_177375 [Podospora aff. communis PSN243]
MEGSRSASLQPAPNQPTFQKQASRQLHSAKGKRNELLGVSAYSRVHKSHDSLCVEFTVLPFPPGCRPDPAQRRRQLPGRRPIAKIRAVRASKKHGGRPSTHFCRTRRSHPEDVMGSANSNWACPPSGFANCYLTYQLTSPLLTTFSRSSMVVGGYGVWQRNISTAQKERKAGDGRQNMQGIRPGRLSSAFGVWHRESPSRPSVASSRGRMSGTVQGALIR